MGKKSGPTAGEKSIANCRQVRRTRTGQGPGQDQDEVKSKMSVGTEVMGVMNRADNTGAKNLVIMIVKDISIYFENKTGVVVNVKGDAGFGDHKTSESRASRKRRTAVLRTQQNSSG